MDIDTEDLNLPENQDKLHEIVNARVLKIYQETMQAFEGKTIDNDYFFPPPDASTVRNALKAELELADKIEAKMKSESASASHSSDENSAEQTSSDQCLLGDVHEDN